MSLDLNKTRRKRPPRPHNISARVSADVFKIMVGLEKAYGTTRADIIDSVFDVYGRKVLRDKLKEQSK